MKQLILLSFILLNAPAGYTQGWNHSFGGSGNETNNKVFICSDGGYISIGNTNSFSLSEDLFVHKTDSLGKFVWQQVLGGSGVEKGNAVAEDATGNLYVVGETNSTGAGGKDFYVVKLSPSGNILWTNTYGGTANDYATGIVINGSNIFISGTSASFGSGLDDIYLIRINSAGTLMFANAFGSFNTEIGRCMAPVHDGGLLIGGTTTYGSTTTGYLVRTNANGDSLWTKIINIGDRSGAGIFGCTELLGDTVFALSGYGGNTLYGNMVCPRVSLNGTVLSTTTSGLLADNGVGITKTSDGGFATAGTYGNFGSRGVLTKFSPLGVKLWEMRLIQPAGLSYATFSIGSDVSETADNGFIFSGMNYYPGTFNNNANLMLIKTDSLGNIPQQIYIQPTVSGTSAFCVGDSTQISVPTGFNNYKWFRFFTPGYNFMWLPDSSSNSIYVDSTGSYGCVMYDEDGVYISNSINITALKIPDATISISGNLSFCSLSDTLTLSAPSITGVNYLWKKNGVAISGATAAIYNPTTSGNYTVTTYNSCDSIVSTPVAVVANATPNLTTNVDTLYTSYFINGNSYCGSQAMSVPFEPGTSYAWYRNGFFHLQTTHINYAANTWGTYYVIGTNGCGTDTSENVIVISDTAYSTITANGPLTGCGTTTIVFTATAYPGATYDWYRNGVFISGGSSLNTFNPIVAGDYYCKITKPCIAFNSIDYTDTISFNYTYFSLTVITAPNGVVACSGSLPISVNNSTASSYQWYRDSVLIPGATSQTYNATLTGWYHCLFSTAACANLSSRSQHVRFGTVIGTISTTNTVICGTSNRQIILSTPDHNSGYTIQWRRNGVAIPGATSSVLSTNIPDVYDCELTNICGSSITNAVTLTANTIQITSNGTIACPGQQITLTSSTLPGYTYQWYAGSSSISGATQSFLTVSNSNTYSVRAFITGCTLVSNSIQVFSTTTNKPDILCNTVPKFCGNDSIQLITEIRNDYSYDWYRNGNLISGQNASSIYASLGGDYIVEVTDSNNCVASSQPFKVNASNVGNFSIIPQGSVVICDSSTVVLNAGFSASTYQWSYYGVSISGATQANHTAAVGGLYGVTVTDAQGCSGYASIFIYKNANPAINVYAVNPASCSQSNGSIQLNFVSGGTYLWSTGSTFSTLNNVPSGLYTVTLTANFCSSSLPIPIPATNYLSPAISGDSTICSGDSSLINAGSFPVYLWSTGQTTQFINPPSTGWYSVSVSDPSQGCSGIDSLFVTVSQSPIVTIAATGSTSFCLGDSVLLDAGSGYNTYKWYRYGMLIPGATSQTYYAKTAGPHQCKASISNGCDDLSNIINITVPCMPPLDNGAKVAEEISGEIEVAPNPSSGLYNIKIPSNYNLPLKFAVTDIIGKHIFEESLNSHNFSLNLTPFPQGIYFIQIEDGTKNEVLKLVKND